MIFHWNSGSEPSPEAHLKIMFLAMSQFISVIYYSTNIPNESELSATFGRKNLYNLAIVLDHAMSQNSQARKRGENSRLYRRRRHELEIFSAAGVIFKRVCE